MSAAAGRGVRGGNYEGGGQGRRRGDANRQAKEMPDTHSRPFVQAGHLHGAFPGPISATMLVAPARPGAQAAARTCPRLKPHFSICAASCAPAATPVAGLSSTTPISVRPFLTASKSRQCPASSVYPVLIPTAP